MFSEVYSMFGIYTKRTDAMYDEIKGRIVLAHRPHFAITITPAEFLSVNQSDSVEVLVAV